MIELNKNNKNEDALSSSDTNKKAENAQQPNNAKRFLCVMLCVVVMFVGIVCVFVNKRNQQLAAEIKISEAEKTNTTGTPAKPQNTSEDTTLQGANSSQGTTGIVQADVTVIAPGTMENPQIIEIDPDNWHLTLVNSGYRIPDSYEPDLIYVCQSGERLDKKVAEPYEKMYNAALKDGVTLTPCSGYRSYETQERNYNRKVEFFQGQGFSTEEAKVKAATIIMPPGSSEHNLGYAMDIVCVDEWFEDTAEFKWLQEHAADYGFIMRYPKEKQDITKVIYEPWHWRYVGVENAKSIKASGLVLEEYLGVQ